MEVFMAIQANSPTDNHNLNNGGISYRKAITGDRSSGGGVVGAIILQDCDFKQFTKSLGSKRSNNASPNSLSIRNERA
jgi:hypothetical protein